MIHRWGLLHWPVLLWERVQGNIDPALIPYIMEKTGKTADEVLDVLNKKSGILALSGFPATCAISKWKQIKAMSGRNSHLTCLLDRIHKYIGSYSAKMGGVDGIIFTAGIGENSQTIRGRILEGLNLWAYIGIGSQSYLGRGSVY